MASTDDPVDPSGGTLESFYEANVPTLVAIGVEEFNVAQGAAENLAHDVMLSSLRGMERGADREVWLAAAMKCASRRYVGEQAAQGSSRAGVAGPGRPKRS